MPTGEQPLSGWKLVTLDNALLTERIGRVPPAKLRELDEGLRLVLVL